MKRLLTASLCVWFLGVWAWAQSGIEIPSIGVIVDQTGSIRAVQGVAGNFLLSPPTTSGVLSAACSEHLCLAKTDSAILSPTGKAIAPPGRAIFSVTGDDAMIYFPETRAFARWHDDALNPLDWKIEDEVISVGATEMAVRRDGSVWIVRPDGAIIDWVADTTGPVLLLPEGVLFATSTELVFRHRDASETRFELAGAENIEQMGPHYAAIHTSDAIYAVRTEPGPENLFLLPGTLQ